MSIDLLCLQSPPQECCWTGLWNLISTTSNYLQEKHCLFISPMIFVIETLITLLNLAPLENCLDRELKLMFDFLSSLGLVSAMLLFLRNLEFLWLRTIFYWLLTYCTSCKIGMISMRNFCINDMGCFAQS